MNNDQKPKLTRDETVECRCTDLRLCTGQIKGFEGHLRAFQETQAYIAKNIQQTETLLRAVRNEKLQLEAYIAGLEGEEL